MLTKATERAAGDATATACDPVADARQSSRGLTAKKLLETVRGMDQEKRWRLGLDLSHAVPVPKCFAA